jgi:hypothetical protein
MWERNYGNIRKKERKKVRKRESKRERKRERKELGRINK